MLRFAAAQFSGCLGTQARRCCEQLRGVDAAGGWLPIVRVSAAQVLGVPWHTGVTAVVSSQWVGTLLEVACCVMECSQYSPGSAASTFQGLMVCARCRILVRVGMADLACAPFSAAVVLISAIDVMPSWQQCCEHADILKSCDLPYSEWGNKTYQACLEGCGNRVEYRLFRAPKVQYSREVLQRRDCTVLLAMRCYDTAFHCRLCFSGPIVERLLPTYGCSTARGM